MSQHPAFRHLDACRGRGGGNCIYCFDNQALLPNEILGGGNPSWPIFLTTDRAYRKWCSLVNLQYIAIQPVYNYQKM